MLRQERTRRDRWIMPFLGHAAPQHFGLYTLHQEHSSLEREVYNGLYHSGPLPGWRRQCCIYFLYAGNLDPLRVTVLNVIPSSRRPHMLSWALVFFLCTLISGLIFLIDLQGPSSFLAGALSVVFFCGLPAAISAKGV